METISLIEHDLLSIVSERTKGQKALSSEHSSALARLEKYFPAKTFTWAHNSVKFSQYCGVISLGNISLEILPKIYGKETEPGACRNALIKMLFKAKRLKAQKSGSANIALQKYSLLDVFIIHFCNQLRTELMQGMIRHYVEKAENLMVLRGRIRMGKQFKYNLAHKERLYCQYDELSDDNVHNQTIKYVLKILMKFVKGVDARKQVTELLMRFDKISDTEIDLQTIDNLRFDHTNCRYEPIFKQCRWFLEGLHPDVLVGNNSCITLLFDMNRLFESYVANILRKLAWTNGIRMQEQKPQKYMIRRGDNDNQIFLMKPDMTFHDQDNNLLAIADAKWKLLDTRDKKLGISQSDLYQMAAYATRYGINKLALVYPKQQWLQDTIELQIQNSFSKIKIIPIDVINDSKINIS